MTNRVTEGTKLVTQEESLTLLRWELRRAGPRLRRKGRKLKAGEAGGRRTDDGGESRNWKGDNRGIIGVRGERRISVLREATREGREGEKIMEGQNNGNFTGEKPR